MIFKFITGFLSKLFDETMSLLFHLIIFVVGVLFVYSAWQHDTFGKVIVIMTGVWLVGVSIVKTYFKISNQKEKAAWKDIKTKVNETMQHNNEVESKRLNTIQLYYLPFQEYIKKIKSVD